MEAKQFREHLAQSAVPIMNLEYYDRLDSKYRRMIDPSPPKLPPLPSGPVLQSGSEEAKMVLRQTFSQIKRKLGYGR